MRVMISGASGLVGGELVRLLTAGGHSVTRLVRREAGEGELRWDPRTGQLDKEPSSGIDAAVHLAGENIAAQRWTADFKRRIRDSRVEGTRRLCETLARWARPPRTLVSASAIGYYGDRGDEKLEENSPAGSGFLAEVARDWEAATQPAVAAGIRVVVARLGVVLSPRGGALAKMLPLFRFGGGGIVGGGRQYWSWISLDDTAGRNGPPAGERVGVGARQPRGAAVRDERGIHQDPGDRLEPTGNRPAARVCRALGSGRDGGRTAAGQRRVEPKRLLESGFEFRHPTLEAALRSLLKT